MPGFSGHDHGTFMAAVGKLDVAADDGVSLTADSDPLN